MPTVLRPDLLRAARSVVEQDVDGSINLMIGIDHRLGDPAVLDRVRKLERPNRRITIIDPGYSTAQPRGGLYSNRHGGSLRTALSFIANAPRLAFLDDDNWHAPNLLSTLASAIEGRAWAFSLRWYCDSRTGEPLAIDQIESVGPGKGVHQKRYGGFCNTSTMMLDTHATHQRLPRWSHGTAQDGRGPDRSIFAALLDLPYGETGQGTAYYWMQHSDINHGVRLDWLESIGLTPSRPTPFDVAARRLGTTAPGTSPAAPLVPAGPDVLRHYLHEARAGTLILIGAPDPALALFVAEAIRAKGGSPTILVIDSLGDDERKRSFLGALVGSPLAEHIVLSDLDAVNAGHQLREDEAHADFVYVRDVATPAIGEVLSAGWIALKRNGVILGPGYDAARKSAFVAALNRFGFERATAVRRCGPRGDRHFLIQRV